VATWDNVCCLFGGHDAGDFATARTSPFGDFPDMILLNVAGFIKIEPGQWPAVLSLLFTSRPPSLPAHLIEMRKLCHFITPLAKRDYPDSAKSNNQIQIPNKKPITQSRNLLFCSMF